MTDTDKIYLYHELSEENKALIDERLKEMFGSVDPSNKPVDQVKEEPQTDDDPLSFKSIKRALDRAQLNQDIVPNYMDIGVGGNIIRFIKRK